MRPTALTRTLLHPHPSFTYHRTFLSPSEQALLLRSSLRLLSSPSQSTSHSRRLLRTFLRTHPSPSPSTFLPSSAYAFESGHFDGVIKGFREMLVSDGENGANVERTWKGAFRSAGSVEGEGDIQAEEEELAKVLRRLYALVPPDAKDGQVAKEQEGVGFEIPKHLQIHLLHLSGEGYILPHVDNRESSGDVIVGVSLGSERVVRFNPPPGAEGEGLKSWEVLLEKGSVYVQR